MLCELRLLVLLLVLTNFCLLSDFLLQVYFRWPVSFWATIVYCNLHYRKSIEKRIYRELNWGLWLHSSKCKPLHHRSYSDPKHAYFAWVAIASGFFSLFVMTSVCLLFGFFLVFVHWLVSLLIRFVNSIYINDQKLLKKGFLQDLNSSFWLQSSSC